MQQVKVFELIGMHLSHPSAIMWKTLCAEISPAKWNFMSFVKIDSTNNIVHWNYHKVKVSAHQRQMRRHRCRRGHRIECDQIERNRNRTIKSDWNDTCDYGWTKKNRFLQTTHSADSFAPMLQHLNDVFLFPTFNRNHQRFSFAHTFSLSPFPSQFQRAPARARVCVCVYVCFVHLSILFVRLLSFSMFRLWDDSVRDSSTHAIMCWHFSKVCGDWPHLMGYHDTKLKHYI